MEYICKEMLVVDPLFTDSDKGDFTLQDSSPPIDAGNPDLDNDGENYTTDVDDQDPDGTRFDMGAYYFHQNFVNSAIALHLAKCISQLIIFWENKVNILYLKGKLPIN